MAKRSMQFSTKRLLISKANSTMVVAVGIAAFLTAFSLVASRSLLIKRSYQSRVIAAQEKARDQLDENIEAVDSLKASYEGFVSRTENLIGGSNTGNGEQDGDNAKIVLDALPSKYDFPALATSLEKILADRNYSILSISGTDEEANQNNGGEASPEGLPSAESLGLQLEETVVSGNAVQMPFELTAQGNYDSMLDLLSVFQRSIRPIFIQTLSMSADAEGGAVQMTVQGRSYYQPEKQLEIKYEVVE